MSIELQDISKTFTNHDNQIRVLKNINLKIGKGEIIAIVGPSGSGKTTLLNILGLIEPSTKGKYLLDDGCIEDVAEDGRARLRNRHFGYVFQSFHLIDYLDARKNVELPLMYGGIPSTERKDKADEVLHKVGLGHRMGHKPSEMSGGERQRLAIGRAIVNDPKVILADEPTGNLDGETAGKIMDLLLSLRETHEIAIVLVTHNHEVARLADRIYEMQDGVLCSFPTRLN